MVWSWAPALAAIGLAAVVFCALLVALAGLLQYRLSSLLAPQTRVVVTLLVIAGGALLSIALTSRTLDDAQRDAANFVAYEDYASGFAASRWLSLLLIGAALLEIVRGALAARRRQQPDPARSMLFAILAYYGGVSVIQTFASAHAEFSYREMYVPIILVAMYFQEVHQPASVIAAAKAALLVLDLGSLLAVAVSPDFVLHRPDIGLVPGVDGRLYGLTAHANTLGPAALLALVLEVHSPSRSWWLSGLQLASATAVLLLAQSRTAWAAGAAILLVVILPLALRPAAGAERRSRTARRAMWTIFGCLLAVSIAVPAIVWSGTADTLLGKLETTSLNGRYEIWDITLRAWRENILFGYGPEVWGTERQWRFHMFHVGHAHNQVIQTLGESGLVGLALLVAYALVLLRAATIRFGASRGIVLALVAILFARFVTEAPMRSEGPLSWSTFLHVLVVVLGCSILRAAEAPMERLAADKKAPRSRPASGNLRPV